MFSDRISMQNLGRFILDADEFRSRILSMPRNPSIIKFFRYPKLAENAGYGIEKILHWERLTGKPVIFHSDLLVSTVEYPISRQLGENNGENKVVVILSVEERHKALLAGKTLVDEKVFLIVPHGIAEIDCLDSPAVAFKQPMVRLGCTRHSRNKLHSALVGTSSHVQPNGSPVR